MIWVNIKARSMYLANFVTALVQSSIMTIVSAGLIWIVLDRFKNINGWTLYEVGFMFAFAKLATSLVLAFFSVLFAMDMLINLGEIDRLLLRPKSPFILFIFQRFDIVFIGDIIAGILIMLYCADKIGVMWSLANILLLMVMILSAAMTYFSLLFMTGTTAFWFLKSGSLKNFIMDVFNIFNPYPIDIYSKGIQIILSLMLPFAFVYYYPSLHFLNKSSQLFPSWFAYVSPLVAAILTGLSIVVWHWGLRSYKSSGT
jgi:ABC-2 type transport system permease protein